MVFKEGSIVAEHYELKRQLGHGSFGDVWLAHNMLADIDVAIKFYGALDTSGLDEFRNEFRVAYKLRHPNLLNINHFDVYENCPYLVMPYCANGSVTRMVGQMPEPEIWKFVLDVSGGLAFLHSQQPPIVHQDIKPDNILITSDGRYVISDFGISRSFRTKMSRTNNNTASSGTIAYMGPERFSEKPLVVLASDIWAFGMTLYELMTGDVLWEGMGGCVQLNGARIPSIEGHFSQELITLATSCLAAETWNRPTAVQINNYAAAYLQGKTIPLLPIQKTKMSVKTEVISTPEVDEPTETEASPAVSNLTEVITEKPADNQSTYRQSTIKRPTTDTPPVDNKSTIRRQSVRHPSAPAYPVNASVQNKPNHNLRNGLIIGLIALVAISSIAGTIMYMNKQYDDELSAKRKRIESLRNSNATTAEPASVMPSTATPEPAAVSAPTPSATAPAAPVRIVEKPAGKQDAKVDDRIEFTNSDNKTTPATQAAPANNSADDDNMFYSCTTISDYQAYLNSFPNGQHRAAAYNAINALSNRDDNTANSDIIVNDVPSRRVNDRPPVGYGNNPPPPRRTGYGQQNGGLFNNRGGSPQRNSGPQRSSSPQRSGSRSGGSSHRHSN